MLKYVRIGVRRLRLEKKCSLFSVLKRRVETPLPCYITGLSGIVKGLDSIGTSCRRIQEGIFLGATIVWMSWGLCYPAVLKLGDNDENGVPHCH